LSNCDISVLPKYSEDRGDRGHFRRVAIPKCFNSQFESSKNLGSFIFAAESVCVELTVLEEGWELEDKLDCSVIVEGLAGLDSVELRITGIGGLNVLDPEVLALLIVECNT
jgi:hypothetical protein